MQLRWNSWSDTPILRTGLGSCAWLWTTSNRYANLASQHNLVGCSLLFRERRPLRPVSLGSPRAVSPVRRCASAEPVFRRDNSPRCGQNCSTLRLVLGGPGRDDEGSQAQLVTGVGLARVWSKL